VEVEVRPMSGEEFAKWFPELRERYAADMVDQAGANAEGAHKKAAADMERLFPGGKPADGQDVFVIEADGRYVGELWVAEREDELTGRGLWIYDVHVDDAFRRKGLGRKAMLFAEDEARRRGVSGVSLNVFGGNDAARSLYRSLGYEELATLMRKDL
jgi:ribosomal protein S18 acetylase RimI-like enzyme